MAVPFLWGSRFSLPSGLAIPNVSNPHMTALRDGTFLVMGKSGTFPEFKITAWIYNADGSLKLQQTIDVPDAGTDTATKNLNHAAIHPMAVELPDGKIAITWTIYRPTSEGTYVAPWVGLYSADLTPIGVPKSVLAPISGARSYAEAIVSLDDGTLVISARDEMDGHAYLRVFRPDGTYSAAMDLGTAGSVDQNAILTDLAALSNGNVAVVVRESTSTLKAYVLTPTGTGAPSLSTSFSIATSSSPEKADVKVTALEGGGFVVTWMEQGPGGSSGYNAFLRVFDGSGNAVSDVEAVPNIDFPELLAAGGPDVLSLPGGGFAVAYEKATQLIGGEPALEVHLALFDNNGTRQTEDIRVSGPATTSSIYLEELHLMADGRILVRHSQGIQIVDPRDEAVSLTGTIRNDQYFGTSFKDTMDGGGGHDFLFGADGDDLLKGGDGNDRLFGDAGADILHGGNGIDVVSFANAKAGVTASLTAGARGDAAGDVYTGIEGLIGSVFSDVFTGSGSAILMGGRGNDVYYAKGKDSVREVAGEGRDTVVARSSFALRSDAEVEVLKLSGVSSTTAAYLIGSNSANEMIGHSGVNTLKGQGGNDVLKAGSGNDRLYGGIGNDTLYGGSGNDVLIGDSGRDIFVFDTRPSQSANVDRIADFNPAYDTIWLDNRVFAKLGTGSLAKPTKLNPDMFVIGATAKDREDRIIYDKATGALYYDADGTGSTAQVKIATLSKNLKLTYHDFFVV